MSADITHFWHVLMAGQLIFDLLPVWEDTDPDHGVNHDSDDIYKVDGETDWVEEPDIDAADKDKDDAEHNVNGC